MKSKVREEEHEDEQQQQKSGNGRRNLIIFLAAFAVVIWLTLYYRLPMLSYYGFYEPDGYFHFSVVRAAVLNGFSIPHQLSISGWPPASRASVISNFGLYWTTLIPYFFLRFAGISYYDIQRLTPVLFGLIDVIAAYFLARYLTKDKLFGILVMLLIGLNMGNAARTSALIYRGDSFVTAYAILALITTLACFRSEKRNKKIVYAIATAFFLALANLVWTGAAFVTAIYIFSFLIIIIFAFTFDKKIMVKDSSYMLLALFLWFLIVRVFIAFQWTGNVTFTNLDFFMVFAPMAVGWYLVHYFTNKRATQLAFVDTPRKRFMLSLSLPVIALLVIYLFIPSLFNDIFVGNGLLASGNFTTTIQEQQLPNYAFLFASFNYQNFISPLSLIVIASTYYSNLIILFWLLLLAVSGIYFFMQTEQTGDGFLEGHAIPRFEVNEAMIVLIAYFAITAYLQMVAIRYNSLLSVPLSILGAYTIYWLMLYVKEHRPTYNTMFALILASVFLLYLTVFINTLAGAGWDIVWYQLLLYALVSIPLSVFIASIVYQIFTVYQKGLVPASLALFCLSIVVSEYFLAQNGLAAQLGTFFAMVPAAAALFLALKRFSNTKLDQYLAYVLILFFILVMLQTDVNYTAGLAPADQVTPNFIQALAWLKNNSASNSVVLTLWPDGSVVEGVANRTSVTDSVGSQYAYKADPFAAWLYNSSPDPGFLLRNLSGKPDYLLVRSTWMLETGGIFTESEINVSANYYGYNPFTSINEHVNQTTQLYQFFSSSGLEAETVISNSSGTQTVASYLRLPNGIQPFEYVDFYNVNSGQFSIIKQTAFNTTNNDTLLIAYSSVHAPNLYVNISAAYMFNTGLANSNMIKFLFQCGAQACIWDNSVADLQLVYVNPDTKIFAIAYNESNSSVQTASAAYPRAQI